jgi:23S rRNA (uracil1939-C5)-methyltransferase
MNLTISIDKLGLDGQGVGFDLNKNIYFVKGAYPGDVVEIQPAEGNKRYKDAELVKVLTKSADRIEPVCEHFNVCGGCDYLDLKYERQLELKQSILKHLLEKNDFLPQTLNPIIAAEQPLFYRNRIQLRKKGTRVGFYQKKSHHIIDISECKTSHPKLNEEIKKLRTSGAAQNEQKIELTLNEKGEVHQTINEFHAAAGFTQVHSEQNEKLREVVKNFILPDSKKVFELFCGDGNLSFSFADQLENFIGIDSNFAVIEKAQNKNKKLSNAFLTYDIFENPLGIAKKFKGSYDTLLLDPPRVGVQNKLKFFIHDDLKKVVYVSCSPNTFIQDCQELKDQGFAFIALQPIDMFPQTKHIEMVGLFVRS